MTTTYLEQFNELSKLISKINAVDVSISNIDESHCEIMRDAISLITETDKYIIECADYNKKELVNLFTQVSKISVEIAESHDDIPSSGYGDLSNGTYSIIEHEKNRCDIAKQAMNRIANSICQRAHLKVIANRK